MILILFSFFLGFFDFLNARRMFGLVTPVSVILFFFRRRTIKNMFSQGLFKLFSPQKCCNKGVVKYLKNTQPFPCLELQQLHNEVLDLVGQPWPKSDPLGQDTLINRHLIFARKRRTPVKHLVEQNPERPDVDTLIISLVF